LRRAPLSAFGTWVYIELVWLSIKWIWIFRKVWTIYLLVFGNYTFSKSYSQAITLTTVSELEWFKLIFDVGQLYGKDSSKGCCYFSSQGNKDWRNKIRESPAFHTAKKDSRYCADQSDVSPWCIYNLSNYVKFGNQWTHSQHIPCNPETKRAPHKSHCVTSQCAPTKRLTALSWKQPSKTTQEGTIPINYIFA